jgi:hypothetical protein
LKELYALEIAGEPHLAEETWLWLRVDADANADDAHVLARDLERGERISDCVERGIVGAVTAVHEFNVVALCSGHDLALEEWIGGT